MDLYKIFLIVFFVVVFIWSGINPPAGMDNWFLENSLVFFAMIAAVILSKYQKISSFSFTLIVVYLLFPLFTSHYGVTGVPFGETASNFLGFSRNMYDRFTHFLFGFLGFYVIYELAAYYIKKEDFSSYYIAFATILASSALYEIFEWIVAATVNPVLAESFYATGGDIFDTPKDLALAFIGVLVASFTVFLYKRMMIVYNLK